MHVLPDAELTIMLYRNIKLCELLVQDIKFGCIGLAPYYIPHFKVHLDGRKGWQNTAGYDGDTTPYGSAPLDRLPTHTPIFLQSFRSLLFSRTSHTEAPLSSAFPSH